MSPVASFSAWTAAGIRVNVPSSAHLRKRVYRVLQGPYRAGTSRHAAPVRGFHTIPFSTRRSSNLGRPEEDRGNSPASASHSTSVSS